MIGVATEDCQRPIDLFQHQHTDNLVRDGQRAEGQPDGSAVTQAGIEPVRPADHEACSRAAGITLTSEPGGERLY